MTLLCTEVVFLFFRKEKKKKISNFIQNWSVMPSSNSRHEVLAEKVQVRKYMHVKYCI